MDSLYLRVLSPCGSLELRALSPCDYPSLNESVDLRVQSPLTHWISEYWFTELTGSLLLDLRVLSPMDSLYLRVLSPCGSLELRVLSPCDYPSLNDSVDLRVLSPLTHWISECWFTELTGSLSNEYQGFTGFQSSESPGLTGSQSTMSQSSLDIRVMSHSTHWISVYRYLVTGGHRDLRVLIPCYLQDLRVLNHRAQWTSEYWITELTGTQITEPQWLTGSLSTAS